MSRKYIERRATHAPRVTPSLLKKNPDLPGRDFFLLFPSSLAAQGQE